MRDFFINSFEKLVAVIIVLAMIAVVIGGLGAMFSGDGFLAGLAILIGGTLYVIMLGGMLYLMLGVYHNTRRTADAVERLASK